MRIYFISIFLLLIHSAVGFAQAQPVEQEVNLNKPNSTKLEVLTFEAVNKLREEKKLEDLIWDEVLFRAAKDHADYLIRENQFSHFQTITGKKTPAQRIKIHGGAIYKVTGENIVAIPLGTHFSSKGIKRSTVTYQSAAYTMAQLWKLSPGHYKNIISPRFNYTAMACAYDSITQRLVAVQVFGYSDIPSSKVDLPDYSSQLLNQPKPKLPYGLKDYHYNPKNKKAIKRFYGLKTERGYITGSYKAAKKTFRGRRSGLVQEFIPLSQFDSTSKDFSSVPNRRNALFELNGKLSKPVYRRQLLKYSRKNTVRGYYIDTKLIKIKKPTTLFVYPLYPNEYETEFNLFFIKGKRLEIYKSYIKIPGNLFEHPFPELQYTDSFKPLSIKDKFKVYHSFDTLQFIIYYPANEIKIPLESELEIRKAYDNIDGKIISVKAAAFASVEGYKASNDKLAKNRMNNFMDLIKPYLDTIVVQPKIQTMEQWRLFYEQIKGTRLQNIRSMEMEQARQYVNDHKSDTLLSKFLDEQRFIKIQIIRRKDFKDQLEVKDPEQRFDSLKLELFKAKNPSQSIINALEDAQLAIYYDLSHDDKSSASLPLIEDLERFPTFKYHELIFQYTVQREISERDFYEQIHMLGRMKNFPGHLKNQLIYNNMVLIYKSMVNRNIEELMRVKELPCYKYRHAELYFKKFKSTECKDVDPLDSLVYPIQDLINEIPEFIATAKRENIKDFPENELWKIYYLYSIHDLYKFIPLSPKIYSYLPGFKKYFHPNNEELTDEEILKFAYFYCAVSRYSSARELVAPIANRPDPNKEALKLYLTLIYDDFEDDHSYAENLIKEFERLGKEEWCDLWNNPAYLNFLLLEDLHLKNFYNSKCDR